MINKSPITTILEKCTGCNKCLRECPIFDANTSYIDEYGNSKVLVNYDKCIACGKCLEVCEKGARDYEDDIDRFFNDLKSGKKINIIVAPAIVVNFPNYKRLFGYLKSLGINCIYDVSFGADITSWAYLKYMKENNIKSMIAQPCPVIVTYIEKFKKELITYLAPIQSPAVCTAIFLKKYKSVEGDIAFLSPCVGKLVEINDVNTKGMINYNVTYKKLYEYLKNNNIDINQFDEVEYENIQCSLGAIYSMPGGLKANIEVRDENVWVRQIEGQQEIHPYLDFYCEKAKSNDRIANVIDILNCIHGCNIGTGAVPNINNYEVEARFMEIKKQKLKEKGSRFKSKIKTIDSYFDKKLDISLFKREYSLQDINISKELTEKEYNDIYMSMLKNSKEEKEINCSACGYKTCKEMARAIYNKMNLKDNCLFYVKKKVSQENEILEQKNIQVQESIDNIIKLSTEREEKTKMLTNFVRDIKNSINEVSNGNEESATAIQDISKELGDIINTSTLLRDSVSEMNKGLENFSNATNEIVSIAEQTNLLSLNASIEAARAGQEGRGFAVVAEEVKKLADQSKDVANSTEEDRYIMVKLIERVMEISSELDNRINKMNEAIETISASIQEITAKGEEIVSSSEKLVL